MIRRDEAPKQHLEIEHRGELAGVHAPPQRQPVRALSARGHR
jgi:hypothetical protein